MEGDRTYVFDAEFDSLNPSILWCVVFVDINNESVYVFRRDEDDTWEALKSFVRKGRRFIGADSIRFDASHLRRLGIVDLPTSYPEHVDLQVVSRLIWYARPGGHSVGSFGERYGIKKPEVIEYDNPDLIDLYEHRCIEDCKIQLKMYEEFKRFIDDPAWQRAIQVEHDALLICEAIKERGFCFDINKATELLEQINGELAELSAKIDASVPPTVKPGPEKVLRRTKDGSPHSTICRFLGDASGYQFPDGAGCCVVSFEPFNPGSHKQRLELLNRAGWKPTEKTKGHLLAERTKDKDKLEKFKEYGWKVNETNLNTLPSDAPEGACLLAEWLTLDGRRGDLAEWIAAYNTRTGALHPKINHIGAWTHRKSHSNPNCANIFGSFYSGMAKDPAKPTPVESVKIRYNNVLRATWTARPDHLLVGTDAEGIQLRILAHAMGDNEYAEAVANGRKEDETDVHNVNRRALELPHLSRDDAKTFIYAWVLGAAVDKVKEILKCNRTEASTAIRVFLDRLPALRQLKQERIPFYARRGYFDGLDGRKVICDSEHLMLAGILQEGESTIMKHANVLWRKLASDEDIPFFQVNDVHDEWQTEVPIVSRLQYDEKGRPWTAESRRLGEIQRHSIEQVGRELGVLTPLAGTTDIGWNWYETH